MRFDAISGTSVGALNAVILSTGAFDEGTKTWRTLTRDQILPFSLPFGLSRFVFALLFPASCFIRCTSGLDPVPETFDVLNSNRREWYLYPRERYQPVYFPLNLMTCIDDQVDACLASAALPFGILTEVYVRGEHCVDGGVIDNIPLWPLIEFAKCDRILVIHHRKASGEVGVNDHESHEDLAYWRALKKD